MKLSIALATRNRPTLLQSTVDRTVANMTLPDTRLVVFADQDDFLTKETFEPKDDRVRMVVTPRAPSLGAKYNQIIKAQPADVYLVMVDYAPHITPGFDAKILEAATFFPDGIGVIYNHLANLSFPGINAVTAKMVEKMGYLYPPYFPYWFVDHWLDDMAKLIGRIAVADVLINTDRRPGTQGMREPAFWASLFDILMLERRSLAFQIIRDPEFQEPEWRKQLLQNTHCLIEERSMMLNAHVKKMQAADTTRDDWYDAIRKRAEAKMLEAIKDFDDARYEALNTPYGQQNEEEMKWLQERIAGVESVLEVGSCFGQSLKLLSRAALKGSRIVSIDRGNIDGEDTGKHLLAVVDELHRDGYKADVFFGDSHDEKAVAFAEEKGPFDFVFIDGDHSYEGAKADWENYGKLGRIVAFHDIAKEEHGVGRLWEEIKDKYEHAQCVRSDMGVGLIYRNSA